VKLFDFSNRRAIEDFRAYAAERAIAFSNLEATNENARQLSILDPLVTEKRFAYVGEPDHFIHEKYAYRLLMLKYLAGRGFTHLGEEIGASDGMRIDRFLGTGDESHLERIAIYGYSGAIRTDRDDTPTGILRDSFGAAYPTAQFAAEQKRFAHGIREIGAHLESAESGSRLHFFGFDIDALPGGGYEDLAEILESVASRCDDRSNTECTPARKGRNDRCGNRAARRSAEIDRSRQQSPGGNSRRRPGKRNPPLRNLHPRQFQLRAHHISGEELGCAQSGDGFS